MNKFVTILFLAVFILAGCTKKTTSSRTEIQTNPFKGYIEERGYLPIELMVTSAQTVEIGYNFSVTRNQKVVKLGAMMPEAGTYVVTLWNVADESILAQANVTVNAKEFTYVNIQEVAVQPRVDYVLSVNTTNNGAASSYFAQKIAEEPYPLYPIQFGILTVNSIVHQFSNTPKFPYSTISDFQFYLMGIPDLQLQ